VTEPYDPLDYENLAHSVVAALLESATGPLPPEHRFKGSGVYAIYYDGDFECYQPIAGDSDGMPIYVGCAMPSGGRKGNVVRKGEPATHALCSRLKQHAKSIGQARNIRLKDFRCRYLVVLPVWVRLAERFLIDHYHPIWNIHVDGFGNHDPGRGRRAGARPAWDVVHPGRPWAKHLSKTETASDILKRVRAALEEGR